MWLATPDFNIWLLSFVGWLPLLWACEGQGVRRVFGYGLLAGTVAIFGGFTWISDLVRHFGGLNFALSMIVQAIFSLYHGLLWALPPTLATALARGFQSPTEGTSFVIHPAMLLPLTWGAVEAVFPMVFETHVSLFWALHPVWIQGAEYVGATGVSMMMVLLNSLLYLSLLHGPTQRSLGRGFALVFILVAVAIPGFGSLRMAAVKNQTKDLPSLKIGVVQANFGINTRRQLRGQALTILQEKSAELEAKGAQMIVWGETTYPYKRVLRDQTTDFPLNDPARIRRGFTVPLVLGLVTRKSLSERRRVWNSALVVDSDDQFGDRYDKNYPLWFGEYAPFVDVDWYLATFPHASQIHLGKGPGVLTVAGYKFGPLICSEDLLTQFTRQTSRLGVHALLAMNNESWFGRSRAQPAHLSLAILRSVESRRALIRVVNAGISAYIEPSGKLQITLPLTDSDQEGFTAPDGFVVDVPMVEPSNHTLFSAIGGWMTWLLWLALASIAFGQKARGARRA